MQPESRPGRVRLVGAGPGAADLLTVRALRAIESAQALLYDALVSDEVLALAPAHCLRIQTGKRAGRASMAQETINRLMLRLARRGLEVVRLKGGDPSIFGRVGEELAFLRAHGVAVEVTPGVTAACAAAAQFGFSLTQRETARQLVFATGVAHDGRSDHFPADVLADDGSTVTLYMARDRIDALFPRLIAAGRDRKTPALAVENAGSPQARLFEGDLVSLPERLRAAAPDGPVVLILGQTIASAGADFDRLKLADHAA